MSVRTSVIESDACQSPPHRSEYIGTAAIARDTPPSERYGAIQDVPNRELQAVWLTGKSIEDALAMQRSKSRLCWTGKQASHPATIRRGGLTVGLPVPCLTARWYARARWPFSEGAVRGLCRRWADCRPGS